MVSNEPNPPKVNQTAEPGTETKKKGFWPKFSNFMASGGFLVILVVVVAIVIGIAVAVSSCQGH